MASKKVRVLTLVSYYLPGYKGGGPLRSIANIVDHLSDEFEFWIIALDRDFGDSLPYPNILQNQWQEVGSSKVYYLSKSNSSLRSLADLISSTPHDVLYLNSFLNPIFTFKPLLARRLGWLPPRPTIVAPRGEFSGGALQIKPFKKSIYIYITKLLKLYHNVTWQASSSYEKADIIRALGIRLLDIQIALDLPIKVIDLDRSPLNYITSDQKSNDLRIIFLSRICSKKNIDYALRILSQVKVNVRFDIYGPLESLEYWEICKKIIHTMPPHITVTYCGSVIPADIPDTFAQYDLFFFPTRGENYGHVIAESLSVGTPVLISDQTPWRNLEADGLGWDFSLQDSIAFINTIEQWALTPSAERHTLRTSIASKTRNLLLNQDSIVANRKLFRQC